jgi:hypothetical protein
LESICSDASSFELSTKQLSEAIKELQHIISIETLSTGGGNELGDEFSPKDLLKLKRT